MNEHCTSRKSKSSSQVFLEPIESMPQLPGGDPAKQDKELICQERAR